MKNHHSLRLLMLAILAFAPSAWSQDSKAQKKAQPPKSLRLYVFDCGSLNIPDTSPYQLKPEELATLRASWWLIRRAP